jgi:hypothetical protein
MTPYKGEECRSCKAAREVKLREKAAGEVKKKEMTRRGTKR